MTEHCKGCGEEMTSIKVAVSRYGHGDICSDCGVVEALYGDFITKYGDKGLGYPSDYLQKSDRIYRAL